MPKIFGINTCRVYSNLVITGLNVTHLTEVNVPVRAEEADIIVNRFCDRFYAYTGRTVSTVKRPTTRGPESISLKLVDATGPHKVSLGQVQ